MSVEVFWKSVNIWKGDGNNTVVYFLTHGVLIIFGDIIVATVTYAAASGIR